MNHAASDVRVAALVAIAQGHGLRQTMRLAGVCKNTVTRLCESAYELLHWRLPNPHRPMAYSFDALQGALAALSSDEIVSFAAAVDTMRRGGRIG